MSMWTKLRKEYTNYTQTDVGKMVGKTKQYITLYENGKIKMPIDLQIIYLGFRNNKTDKMIIEYLKELKNE